MKYEMLKSSTRFWKGELEAENERIGLVSSANDARNTAGVPCKNDMKQLDASGRCFGPQFRNTMKRPIQYMMQKIGKNIGKYDRFEIRVSIAKRNYQNLFRIVDPVTINTDWVIPNYFNLRFTSKN